MNTEKLFYGIGGIVELIFRLIVGLLFTIMLAFGEQEAE